VVTSFEIRFAASMATQVDPMRIDSTFVEVVTFDLATAGER
jgi:hypothetical protein